jgi:hypothetical protein
MPRTAGASEHPPCESGLVKTNVSANAPHLRMSGRNLFEVARSLTVSQGSSQARNPGLEGGIPSGFQACKAAPPLESGGPLRPAGLRSGFHCPQSLPLTGITGPCESLRVKTKVCANTPNRWMSQISGAVSKGRARKTREARAYGDGGTCAVALRAMAHRPAVTPLWRGRLPRRRYGQQSTEGYGSVR